MITMTMKMLSPIVLLVIKAFFLNTILLARNNSTHKDIRRPNTSQISAASTLPYNEMKQHYYTLEMP
jgi:hypothetical protein